MQQLVSRHKNSIFGKLTNSLSFISLLCWNVVLAYAFKAFYHNQLLELKYLLREILLIRGLFMNLIFLGFSLNIKRASALINLSFKGNTNQRIMRLGEEKQTEESIIKSLFGVEDDDG